MASTTTSFLAIFFLSNLTFLHSAQEDDTYPPDCKRFYCGPKIEFIGFPFFNTTDYKCGGLCEVNCSDTKKYIKLGNKSKWYDLLSISQGNIIEIRDQELHQRFNSRSCDSFQNITLPSSHSISFKILHDFITFFKCTEFTSEVNEYFRGYHNYTRCPGNSLYNTYPNNHTGLATATLPPNCSVIQLPPLPKFSSPKSVDPFDLICPILLIEWHLTKEDKRNSKVMLATACAPTNCGQHNISYPFYIKGQNSSCGYPGFELNCTNNGYPVLQMPQNDYVVDQIYYKNRSVRVYNAAVLSVETGCLPQIGNLSLDNRFSLVNDSGELVLFTNCSRNISSRELLGYRVECGGWELAMLRGDEEAGVAMEECKTNVVAPVEVFGGDEVTEYGELVRRGFVLNWMASDCGECEKSRGRCGFDYASYRFMCFCPDRPHFSYCLSNKSNSKVILATATSGGVVTIICIIVLIIVRKKLRVAKYAQWGKKTESYYKVENFLKINGSVAPKRYCYSDIKKMTRSFKDKLGQGGYGYVYKGKLDNGSLVAVKVLKESKGNGEEFVNEVASISRTSHVNVVTLLGFCFEGRKRALIYEFMPNGSLEKFVSNGIFSVNSQLGWDKSYRIAIGIARGLEYLHRGCNTRILHFDIKPHNILLDEDFIPKISDFGLAKLCHGKDSAVSMLYARGTIGYIAPEVFCRNFGRVSHKSDVYSYGMMVLEIVGGRKNIEVEDGHTSEIYFPDWIYKKLESDKELRMYGMNEDENVYARKMIIVSLWCIQSNPSTRPSMSRVVEMLEGSLESLKIPPEPVLSSPPVSPAHPSIIEIS